MAGGGRSDRRSDRPPGDSQRHGHSAAADDAGGLDGFVGEAGSVDERSGGVCWRIRDALPRSAPAAWWRSDR